ncbi:Uncharacterised protein [uncultured archaeon]|nr:Uncharacterised protein [uncultured archaeon]
MKKIILLIIFSSILIMSLSLIAAAPPKLTTNSSNNLTNPEIKVGIYILNLGKFDISTGSFTADFYLSLKCNGTCPEEDFEFMNGRATSIDKIIDNPDEKFYRIQANLNSPIDLKKFPYDKQKVQIVIEDKKNTIDKVRYIPDDSGAGIDSSVTFTGWIIGTYNQTAEEHYYEAYDETYSQYVFTIPISKIVINSTIKTIIPVVFIIIVMLSSFILDIDKVSTRIGMVSSALVASVMFHVSLSNQIPPLSYLTFMDKFMVLTYFVILVSFSINIAIMELTKKEKAGIAEKIHKKTEYTMLIIVPILYLILFFWFL